MVGNTHLAPPPCISISPSKNGSFGINNVTVARIPYI